MGQTICVFGSSSNTIDRVFFQAAESLGRELCRRGHSLLFGGGLTGLMGACARAVHEENGTVIGVIPEILNEKGIVYESCDELVVTDGLRPRKAVMDERSDGFIALPGGFGTVEEVMEIITLKQLRCHNKPIVVLNTAGYYDPLLEQLRAMVDRRFARPDSLDLFFVTGDVSAALDYIDGYTPRESGERWLTDVDVESTGHDDAPGQAPPEAPCFKIETYIPKTHLSPIRDALRRAGAGRLGPYEGCMSYSDVTGCWHALPGSSPYEGARGVDHSAPEYKVEALCVGENVAAAIEALRAAHPYETPVIIAIPLHETGLGD